LTLKKLLKAFERVLKEEEAIFFTIKKGELLKPV